MTRPVLLLQVIAAWDGRPPLVGVGDIVAHKFRVERIVAAGGMGVVVAAKHIQLGHQVALKFMRAELLQNVECGERFLQEARAAVRLRSEHVCRIFDVGTLETGAPYLVMEYLDGADLGQLRREQGALGVERAVDCVLQACEAVAEAHAAGIVHRDLKPENLFLTTGPDGGPFIKVLDFGIAKSIGAAEQRMTRTDSVMGSPAYMSPEQLRSARAVDARSDIWSLGVILYELVFGSLPFRAENPAQLCLAIYMDPPLPIPLARAVANAAAVEKIVRRCLEKDPAARYASVAELAAALAPLGPADAPGQVAIIRRVLGECGAASPRAARRSRRRLLLVALGAAGLVGLGLFLLRGEEPAPPAPDPPPPRVHSVLVPLPMPAPVRADPVVEVRPDAPPAPAVRPRPHVKRPPGMKTPAPDPLALPE